MHNLLCELFQTNPELVNGSNDDVVDAFKDKFGRQYASESITRCWRKLKELNMYRPTNQNVILRKEEKEKLFRKHYGNRTS